MQVIDSQEYLYFQELLVFLYLRIFKKINVIFDVLGTPDIECMEEEYNFLSDPDAIKYLKTFNKRPRKNL